MTTVIVDDSYPQAKGFLQYARTLPFAQVKRQMRKTQKSKWQQALDEGAVSVDQFFDELNARIEKWPDNA
jgi:methylphosphotriester-DNA--protein-cysteine methyltransferase